MPEHADPNARSINVTVDAKEFFAFARALKRSSSAAQLGEVVFSLRRGCLTIQSKRGGSVHECEAAAQLTARVTAGNFLRWIHLTERAPTSGPLVITFRPALGEIALPNAGTKAEFL